MLLLDQETVSFDNARIIAVVSQRENILSEVAQVLRTRGLENIEIVKRDLFVSSEGLSFSAEIMWVLLLTPEMNQIIKQLLITYLVLFPKMFGVALLVIVILFRYLKNY